MLRFAALFMSLTLLVGAPVQAQENPVVVELFTSQGCSSCPPADALLHDLAERDDVIALALHVDYWDYIGWKDEFALPVHAQRQKAYAHVGGRRMIYTPQMVINGVNEVVGAKAMEIFDTIAAHKAQPALANVSTALAEQQLTIALAPAGAAVDGEFAVIVVRYSKEREVHIRRGENAGRHLKYVNVVSEWTIVDTWDGATAIDLETEVSGDMETAVLVQQIGPSRIIAAARVN